ncbi:ricin-type beta-trefoil lectin domain protein [Streptomyces sp. NPDC056291]|uniref:ricin-type beta-trefoil lectin domain protein n=2 Tax=unclassified Streptomyces TaxID=2593676 RepID=UPI0035E35CE3
MKDPGTPNSPTSPGPFGTTDEQLSAELRKWTGTSPALLPVGELLDRHWEAAFTYARLCVDGPHPAGMLTTAAFTRLFGESLRQSGPTAAWRPQLLVTVRRIAAEWSTDHRQEMLHPELRAAGADGDRISARLLPPGDRRLLSRAFQQLPQTGRALVWHAEVEAEPPAAPARLLGLDEEDARVELGRARERLREECLQVHREVAPRQECLLYLRLLDVTYRRGGVHVDPDLRTHLAGCTHCRHTADQLAQFNADLGGALAEGVLGWGARAYRASRLAGPSAATEPEHPAPAAESGPAAPAPEFGTAVPAGGEPFASGWPGTPGGGEPFATDPSRPPAAGPAYPGGRSDASYPGGRSDASYPGGRSDASYPGGRPDAPYPGGALGTDPAGRPATEMFAAAPFAAPAAAEPWGSVPPTTTAAGDPAPQPAPAGRGTGAEPGSADRGAAAAGPGDGAASAGGTAGGRAAARGRSARKAARRARQRNLAIAVATVSGLVVLPLALWAVLGSGDGTPTRPEGQPSGPPGTGASASGPSWTGAGTAARGTLRGRLHNAASGLCVDVVGKKAVEGAETELAACSSAPGQQWVYETDGLLRSGAAPGLCLDSRLGYSVRLAPCVDGSGPGARNIRYDFTLQGTLVPRFDQDLALTPAATDGGGALVLKTRAKTDTQRWAMDSSTPELQMEVVNWDLDGGSSARPGPGPSEPAKPPATPAPARSAPRTTPSPTPDSVEPSPTDRCSSHGHSCSWDDRHRRHRHGGGR